MPGVPLIAHRFGRAYGPDSSREALDRALSAPVGGLETDCCLTRDGRLILLHDPYLPTALGVPGWAGDHTADELLAETLRSSLGEPTQQHPLMLEDLLGDPRVAETMLQIEVKAYADPDLANRTATALVDALRASGRTGPTEVISFWPDACAVAAAAGFATRVIVACAYTPDALATWAQERGVSGVILEAHYFSRPVVEAWRGAGLDVMSGVCNDPTLARLVLDFEPDAMATDRPHELAQELAVDV